MNKLIIALSPALLLLTGCSKEAAKAPTKPLEDNASGETVDKEEQADQEALDAYYKTRREAIMKKSISRAEKLIELGQLLLDYDHGEGAIRNEAVLRSIKQRQEKEAAETTAPRKVAPTATPKTLTPTT